MANASEHKARQRDREEHSPAVGRAGGHGIVRDQRGQDQPTDRERAQRIAGKRAQEAAAQSQPPSPGQPAKGE